jgi:hypothetical protein
MNGLHNTFWQTITYYALATLFTSWFIATAPFTLSPSQIVLSNVVASSKWVIQIIAAFIFLGTQRGHFIKHIGFVYFIGSCLLLPFVILSYTGVSNDLNFFNVSHLLSIMIMIFLYYRAVELSQLGLMWWLVWVACQIIGILLQVTWVFRAV